MATLERRLPRPASYFLRFAKDLTSQGGEDGILEEIYRLLDRSVSSGITESYPKYCVDIGAWDGKHLSNTYNLLNTYDWSGLLVEAERSRYEQLRDLYADRVDRIKCVSQLVGFEGENSLSNLLTKNDAPSNPGFLCIDIDGADYHLWKSVGTQFRAIVVCIEFNPTIPNDVFFIQAPQVEIQQGSSLCAIHELGQSLGYTLIVTTTFNAIFVRNDYLAAFPDSEEVRIGFEDINKLHCPFMTTAMFQTYDGELKYVGTKKLLWHKIALNPQKLQMLSKKERKYPFAPSSESNHLLLKVNDIQSMCNQAIESITVEGSFNICSSNLDTIIKSIQSLIDFSNLPVLEEISIEAVNRMMFLYSERIASISKQVSHDEIFTFVVDVVKVVENHANNIMKSDCASALKFLELIEAFVENVVDREVINEPSRVTNLLWQVRVNMIRCHRLQGNLLVAWKILKRVDHHLSFQVEVKEGNYHHVAASLQKEKQKLMFLLNKK